VRDPRTLVCRSASGTRNPVLRPDTDDVSGQDRGSLARPPAPALPPDGAGARRCYNARRTCPRQDTDARRAVGHRRHGRAQGAAAPACRERPWPREETGRGAGPCASRYAHGPTAGHCQVNLRPVLRSPPGDVSARVGSTRGAISADPCPPGPTFGRHSAAKRLNLTMPVDTLCGKALLRAPGDRGSNHWCFGVSGSDSRSG